MSPRSSALRASLALALCAAGGASAGVTAQEAAPDREPYRPSYHFSPARNWMNDPNGLVHYAGEYHLFYQYNPFGDTWGHMSWGHAVSPDLVHWRHLPVALPEVDGVMAFSGSAVVDRGNTSGFGRGGEPPLVAVYTGHREGNQSQFLAYSTDRGRTWTPYAGNPVLDVGRADFRDPKVFWYAPQRKWVMVLALPPEHRVAFYTSPDLKHWTELSEFGPAGAVGGAWECPDLFPLPLDGDPARTRWVLIVNLNPGGVAGGSGTQYFVGRFDGTRFTPESPAARARADTALWADYGQDFYAAVSWSDVPASDGRRIWIGWMNNWLYGQRVPTHPWRSAQSVPRSLTLRSTPAGPRLVQTPVRELRSLRGPVRALGSRALSAGTLDLSPLGVSGESLELEVVLEPGTARQLGVKVRTGAGEETVIGVDPGRRELFLDRSRSGRVDFHPDFGRRQSAPLDPAGGPVRLHVLVDRASVEVFADGGRVVITDQVFPSPGSTGVSLYAEGGAARLVSLRAWPLRSAWTAAGAAGAASRGTR